MATAHHTTGTMEHMLMANDALQGHLSRSGRAMIGSMLS